MNPEAEALYKYANNPLKYTRDVIGIKEFDQWQIDVLNALPEHHQIAVGSGHGVGKTAEIAFIIKWFIATRPNPQIVVTANTKPQLD
jgi:hypothetical protein